MILLIKTKVTLQIGDWSIYSQLMKEVMTLIFIRSAGSVSALNLF